MRTLLDHIRLNVKCWNLSCWTCQGCHHRLMSFNNGLKLCTHCSCSKNENNTSHCTVGTQTDFVCTVLHLSYKNFSTGVLCQLSRAGALYWGYSPRCSSPGSISTCDHSLHVTPHPCLSNALSTGVLKGPKIYLNFQLYLFGWLFSYKE